LNGSNLWLRGAFCALTLAVFLVLHRDDLAEFLSRGRRFKYFGGPETGSPKPADSVPR
jgi:hypothetical protein